jgi:hypothetical protein
MGTVGIIANPLAGKDVRRLVAHASPTSDSSKIGIVRRAVAAALDGGAKRVLVAPDCRSLSERATDDLGSPSVEMIDEVTFGQPSDTSVMARIMRSEGVEAIIVLGGDGTHRDVAKGWCDATMVAISTGTNNVFPRFVEATLAGTAAALVAEGVVPLSHAAQQSSLIEVHFADGSDDLALVDVALVTGSFIGSRAVWEAGSLQQILACIAEPASVGLSSIPALLHPLHRFEPGGVHVVIGGTQRTVRAPLAPGTFVDVPIAHSSMVPDGHGIVFTGPGVLSFDGERDHVLADGEQAVATISRRGPHVIDVDRTITLAAKAGHFVKQESRHHGR